MKGADSELSTGPPRMRQTWFSTVCDTLRSGRRRIHETTNVKTPAQYIAAIPFDRTKTIETVRALVNKHIPRAYEAPADKEFPLTNSIKVRLVQ
jgi:hypothetical protein